MAKVYIFTDEKGAIEFSGELLDEYLSSLYEDSIFILSEDGKNIFLTEDGTALFIQEYKRI